MVPDADAQRLAHPAQDIPAGHREVLAALTAAAGVSSSELTRTDLITAAMFSVAVRLGENARQRPWSG